MPFKDPDKQKAYTKAYYDAHKAKIKAYREANKEKIRAWVKSYYQANRGKIKARMKAWFETNKDEIKARRKARREARPDKVRALERAYLRAWIKANPNKVVAYNAKMKAKRRSVIESPDADLIDVAALKEAATVCPYCGEELKSHADKYLDHVQSLALGGEHKLWNVLVCCAGCNRKKHDKMPLEFFVKI